MHFFMDGSFVTEQDAKIPILDLGLIRGFAVFDYLRTYERKPFHFKEHLQRLRYSAGKTGLSVPYTFEELEEITRKLISLNPDGECGIKLLVTGGVSANQLLPSQESFFTAFSYPVKPYPLTHFTEGIHAITTSHKRCLPDCKTTQYLPAIISLQEGRKTGAAEALYTNEKREILEGVTSNFFAFKNGVLITAPEDGLLLGITRAVILALCENKFPIEFRSIRYEEIGELDEAFITASNKEVMPVVSIDHFSIKNGKPGRLTKEVMALFADYTRLPNPKFLEIARHASRDVSPVSFA